MIGDDDIVGLLEAAILDKASVPSAADVTLQRGPQRTSASNRATALSSSTVRILELFFIPRPE